MTIQQKYDNNRSSGLGQGDNLNTSNLTDLAAFANKGGRINDLDHSGKIEHKEFTLRQRNEDVINSFKVSKDGQANNSIITQPREKGSQNANKITKKSMELHSSTIEVGDSKQVILKGSMDLLDNK